MKIKITESVKSGDTIKINYTGRFENGKIFDSSKTGEPLKFTVGSGQLIEGFDAAVTGMSIGETKTVTIPPEKGYGVHNQKMVFDLPKTIVPDDIKLKIGMKLELMDKDGRPVPAQLTAIEKDVIRMDANHPLAGQTLIFEIEVIETGLEPNPVVASCGCGKTCGTGQTGCCGGS